jgi:hypothetical protein
MITKKTTINILRNDFMLFTCFEECFYLVWAGEKIMSLSLSSSLEKEIEDPIHYVKLDIKKIEPINGLLQLVQQNQLKNERAQIIKQKYVQKDN